MTEEELRAICKGCRERYPDGNCRGCPNYADVELVQHEQSQADLISKLEAELEQVKRERDAAANDMRQFTMDWWEDGERFPCRYCTYADENNCRWKIEHPGDTKGCFGKYFKWRGVKEGNRVPLVCERRRPRMG